MIRDAAYARRAYGSGEEIELRLDVYGESAGGSRPLAAWFHGGGFKPRLSKDSPRSVALCERLAGRGFVAASVEYRRRPDPGADPIGTLRDAAEDALAALAFLRREAVGLGADPGNLFMIGGSAGGMLCLASLLLASARGGPGILGCVSLWGAPEPAAWRGLGWPAYERFPPVLLIHGDADRVVPAANSAGLAEELRRAGVACEFRVLAGADHTPDERQPEVDALVDGFLDERLAAARDAFEMGGSARNGPADEIEVAPADFPCGSDTGMGRVREADGRQWPHRRQS